MYRRTDSFREFSSAAELGQGRLLLRGFNLKAGTGRVSGLANSLDPPK
jgi:hypothetical protein